MLDKKRIMSKISELESYLEELGDHIPKGYEDYMDDRDIRRICERLLQISVECVIDISSMLARGLKLGPPSDENDLFNKLKRNKTISNKLAEILKKMKGFRNILVHRYAEVDDELVFQFLKNNIKDFLMFKKEVLDCLNQQT